MKRIGIYDRYLSTAGGGERYSCKMAEILSMQKGFQVDLITDIFSDLKKVSSRLNLDLSKVELKLFPFLSDEYAQRITRDYDIFINSTYLSSLSAFGKRNIYLCYFPTSFDVDFGPLHRFLLLFFRRIAIWLYRLADKTNRKIFEDIEVFEGIYDQRRFFLGRGAWSSGKALIGYKKNDLPIRIGVKNPVNSGIDIMDCTVKVFIKSSKASGQVVSEKRYKLEKGKRENITIELPKEDLSPEGKGSLKPEYMLSIESDYFIPASSPGSQTDTRLLGCVVYNQQQTGFLKKLLLRLIGYIPLFLVTYPKDLGFLETYDRIISISEYSNKWVSKSWKKESTILYPPVDIQNFKISKKEKIILSVGRFFPEHHNKKQLELAENFIDLYREHKEVMSGYSLYLAGGVEDKKEHQDYVRKIEELSTGYPVKIFKNMDYGRLVDLFAKAFLFWHAAGMGEDAERHPEKFEHFGITTVEAMASGCIPVVINRGGQSEIIKNNENGFLFEDWSQLKEVTLDICSNPGGYRHIGKNAVLSSTFFSSEKFHKDLLKIINEEVDGKNKHNINKP